MAPAGGIRAPRGTCSSYPHTIPMKHSDIKKLRRKILQHHLIHVDRSGLLLHDV